MNRKCRKLLLRSAKLPMLEQQKSTLARSTSLEPGETPYDDGGELTQAGADKIYVTDNDAKRYRNRLVTGQKDGRDDHKSIGPRAWSR